MTQTEIIAELTLALGEAAAKFNADTLKLHLANAAKAISRRLKPMQDATLTLQSGVSSYPAPPDLAGVVESRWGVCASPVYSADYTGRAPRWFRGFAADGLRLRCSPAPNDAQIARYGASMAYRYAVNWVANDSDVTVPEVLRELLILRAVIECMQALATSGTVKPIQLHKGMGSTGLVSVSASSTPEALAKQLMEAFEREVLAMEGYA